jgi:hypothetical protein
MVDDGSGVDMDKRDTWIDKIVKNELAYKTIFDNVRNLLVCGIILTSGQFEASHLSSSGFFRWLEIAFVCILYGVGFVLWWINIQYGIRKLREAAVPRCLLAMLGGLYAVLALEVIAFILKSKTGN